MGHRSWRCLTNIILDACWNIFSIKCNMRWREHRIPTSVTSLVFFLKYFIINPIIRVCYAKRKCSFNFPNLMLAITTFWIFSQYKSLYFDVVYNKLTGFACIWDLDINAWEVHKQVSVWRPKHCVFHCQIQSTLHRW